MTQKEVPDTEQKALTVNLEPAIYGSMAEIGAGQEIARHFFRAGAASGTIAKTMSAYDMTFSDEIYGKEEKKRYVCESRLHKMLEHEYKLIIDRLYNIRSKNTTFFALANTCATRSYQGTQDGHGWMGIRFQKVPGSKPNDVILHIRMKDYLITNQQQAMGIIGVNLIYACYFYFDNPERFLTSLMDNIMPGRCEIDMVSVHGPDFEQYDSRLLSMWLVKYGMANAVMFDATGKVVHAAEMLYKKNVFALRGSFRPPTHVNFDMLESGFNQFLKEPNVDANRAMALTEITTTSLRSDGELSDEDFLARIDLLSALGQNVLLSNFHEYHRLSHYFAQYTQEMVVTALGINNLQELFNEEHYKDLAGGILQAFGEQFNRTCKLYIYPMMTDDGNRLITLNSVKVPPHLKHLFLYLLDNGYLAGYESFNPEILHIYSRKVLRLIQSNEPGWEEMVPKIVADTIEKKCLFGYGADHCKI